MRLQVRQGETPQPLLNLVVDVVVVVQLAAATIITV